MSTSLITLACGTAALILAATLSGAVVGTPASAHRAADTATEVDGPNILQNGGFERGADPGTGPGAQPAPLTLKLATASLAAGDQQTVQATAGKGASVALVVDYPDGSQLVVPGHAGPDGHYSYSWALPSSIHGTVKVWLDAGGSIAQATFSVS